jgi:hypothetical protein
LGDKGEKGVVPGKAGCVEHSAISNAIISDAVKRKKDLFIASLDLMDVFGSAPHNFIERNMKKLSFPKEVIKIIMESYNNAFINVQTNTEFTENIRIRNGVKHNVR